MAILLTSCLPYLLDGAHYTFDSEVWSRGSKVSTIRNLDPLLLGRKSKIFTASDSWVLVGMCPAVGHTVSIPILVSGGRSREGSVGEGYTRRGSTEVRSPLLRERLREESAPVRLHLRSVQKF